jgi:RHS repeat-associated protein
MKYTGQRQEASIGLYFYGARWYDPYLNRWIQPDSIIPDPLNPIDFDRFAYTRNNPTKYRDPTGHCVEGADDFEDCMEWVKRIEASWDFVNVIICGGGEYADGCIGWTAMEMSLLYDTLSEYMLSGMVDDGLISFIRTNSDEYSGLHTAGSSGGIKTSEIRLSNGAWTINPLLGIQDTFDVFSSEFNFQATIAHELTHAAEWFHPEIVNEFEDIYNNLGGFQKTVFELGVGFNYDWSFYEQYNLTSDELNTIKMKEYLAMSIAGMMYDNIFGFSR